MHIEATPQVHANQADEVYLRIGDKSKLLKFEDRLQLTYDKGERYFEDKIVPDATVDDLDIEQVKDYVKRIGYNKSPIEFLKQNNGFVIERDEKLQVSTAALLLFGKNPQNYLPRARVRFIRYEGIEEKFGIEMNVIKDVIFKGTILKMIKDSIAYLDTQIKEKTYLGADNIRFTHFSRNPKIAEFLKAYNFVKEYGEGVDRMCKELEAAGQKSPEYQTNAFMLQTVIYNGKNPAIHQENPAIHQENPAIHQENPAIQNKKLKKETLKTILTKQNYFVKTKEYILEVYNYIDTNQVFGAPEVKEILGCTSTVSKDIMKKLRDIDVVVEVKGKGKGKYRFIYEDEI